MYLYKAQKVLNITSSAKKMQFQLDHRGDFNKITKVNLQNLESTKIFTKSFQYILLIA